MEYKVMQVEKVLYTGKTHSIGGRVGGTAKSNDDRLNIAFSVPGTPGNGTNPEQLFAAGWSACFIGALGFAAAQQKLRLPADTTVDAEVDLATIGEGYFLQARLNVHIPGIDPEVAQSLVETAHQTCPYSKLTKGNINVTLNLI